jgi:hypothetical protein
VTYSRLRAAELYHVDEAGDLAGGLSRALVVLNFPHALLAIALAALAARPRPLVVLAIALCALTAAPGVVDQDDLDARAVNALPALGVVLALALTIAAVRLRGTSLTKSAYGDRLRLVLSVLLLVLALPWLAAEWGFHFPGDVLLGEEVPVDRDPGIAAVHLGFHHGYAGVVFAWAALLLSRIPAGRALRAYLALMLAYGLVLAVQDSWNEQLWKRGTVDWMIPDPIRPDLTWPWLVIVTTAAATYALWFRPGRSR